MSHRMVASTVSVVVLAAMLVQGAGRAAAQGTSVSLADGSRQIVLRTASSDDEDPLSAGKTAAAELKRQLGDLTAKAILVGETYEGRESKAKVVEGVCSVFPAAIVFGGSTYGGFCQKGVCGGESVMVSAIAGSGVDVQPACIEKMDTAGLTLEQNREELEKRIAAAGSVLAGKFNRTDRTRLLLVIADAHSPKNGALVQGIQSVLGPAFPITGGSVNKNAGQSFVYWQGRLLSDAVVGLMLSGDFKLALAGRQAKDNDQVIATAREGAAEAIAALQKQGARPAVLFAFDCAGRKGKLKNVADELSAIRQSTGADLPILGTYNAGEIGPADVADKTAGVLSSGMGWHAMFTAIGW